MQNVVNYLCPFFRNRQPIVGGKVYFVKPSTTAQTFNSVASIDYADYIAVKDKDGTLLENPLPLNDEGSFETQPFVEDGVEFKMIVCYPTGQPARHNDETPCWEVAYTIDSKTQTMEVHYDGVACVDGIYDLAQLQPSVGRAIVLGYASKNDFCPPRFFEWVTGENGYNRGTVLRSSVSNTGAWVCVPSGFVDVRWFGVDPASQTDYTSVLSEIAQACANVPAYFPTGNYYLSNHVVFQNAIAENGVRFYPDEEVTNDLKFEVVKRFEDRGAHFMGNANECVIYPKIKGLLRTSCLSSLANAALSATALTGVDEVVFDSSVSLESGSNVTISGKKVLVKSNATIPSGLTFDAKCEVYYEESGEFWANRIKLAIDWMIRDLSEGADKRLQIDCGNETLIRLTLLGAYIAKKATLAQGFIIDALNSGNSWERDSLQRWVLNASRAEIVDLVSTNSVADNEVVTNEQIMHMARYDDSALATVDNGVIAYSFGANPDTDTYTAPYVPFSKFTAKWPNAKVITVMLTGENSSNLVLELPNSDSDTVFIVYNPKLISPLYLLHEGSTVNVLVLGLFNMEDLSGNSGVSKFVVRKPTDAERTRFNISSNQKWIIDPLSM